MIYPSMAILRRYAAMFRVGTSFIFSSIKSRSASVTLNLICTVLLRPFMYSLLIVLVIAAASILVAFVLTKALSKKISTMEV